MMQKLFALSLGLAGWILATNHAFGQQAAQCGQRDALLAQLSQDYGETRKGLGLAANHALVEIFASGKTGTWTILVTLPGGTSCLLASGEDYEVVTEPEPAPGSPA